MATYNNIITNVSGSVGIGTTNAASRLTVLGNASLLSEPIVTLRPGGLQTSGVAVLDAQDSSGNSLLFVSGSGNVGIGSSTPAVKLDVAGAIRGTTFASDRFGLNANPLNTTSTTQSFLRFQNIGADFYIGIESSTAGAFFPGSVAYSAAIYNGSATPLHFFTSATLRATLNTAGNFGLGAGTNITSKFLVTGSGASSATSAAHFVNSSGTSLFFVRDDGNVGVGTSNPAGRLDVASTTAPSIYITRPGLGSSYGAAGLGWLRFRDADNAFDAAAVYGVGFHPGSNGTLLFYTAAAGTLNERARIDTSGNFGIGTNAPAARLHVSGSSTSTEQTVLIRGGTPSQLGPVFEVEDSIGNTLMIVSGSGNVGVGTNNPLAKLNVVGSSANTIFSLQSTDSTYARMYLLNTNRNWSVTANGTTLGPTGAFVIADETAGAFRFIIDANGNTSIGPVAPTARLHVTGSSTTTTPTALFRSGLYAPSSAILDVQDANNTSMFWVSGSSGTANVFVKDNLYIGPGTTRGLISADVGGNLYYTAVSTNLHYFASNSTYKMVVGANGVSINNGATQAGAGMGLVVATGNIGIGTTTTTDTLAVSGQTSISGSVIPGTNNLYDIGSTTKSWRNVYAVSISGSLTGSNVLAGQIVVAGTGGVLSGSYNIFQNLSTGNVGIGTSTSLTGKLNVVGDVYNTGYTLYSTLLVAPTLQNNGALGLNTNAASPIAFNTNNVERMRITAVGDVGIGTTTYTGRFYVSGSSTATTPTMVVREGVASPTGGVGIFDVQNSAGTSFFFVSGSGDVGIGTAVANASLGIARAAGLNAYIETAGGGRVTGITSMLYGQDSAGNSYVWNRANAGVFFGTNGTSRWTINNSGHFITGADNAYDIGALGATRPRTVYVGTSLFTGDNVGIGTTNTNGNRLAISGGNLSVTGSILPGVTTAYDLGSTTYRWRDVYARSGSFTGDVTVSGDLFVNGTQFIVNTQVVEIEDNAILLNAGPSPASTGGIYVADTTSGITGSLLWDATTDQWKAGKLGSETTLVSGSGTTNYVSKWTGTNGLGNSALTESSSIVNITSTSNNAELRLNNSFSRVAFVDAAGGFAGGYNVKGNAGPFTNVQHDSLGSLAAIWYSTNGILFYANTSQAAGSSPAEVMRIANAGNVGIGTTGSLTARLQVQGTATGSDTTLLVKHNVANGANLPVLDVQNSTGTSLLFVSGSGNVGIGTAAPSNTLQLGLSSVVSQDTNTMYLGSNFTGTAAGNFIGSAWALQQYFDRSNGIISFRRSSASGTAGNAITWSESARLDSAGNLLIRGTTQYGSAKLQVVYGDDSNGAQVYAQIGLQYFGGGYSHYIQTLHNTTADDGNAIRFYLNTAGTAAGSSAIGTGNALSYFMGYSTHRWNTGGSERMRIDSSGNIGIGTSTYAARLFVSGSAIASTSTMVIREGVVSPTSAAEILDVQNSAGTSILVVSGSSRVGINTTTLTESLNISGNTLVAGSGEVQFNNSSQRIYSSSGGLLVQAGGRLRFFTGGANERINIEDVQGLVGIGTSGQTARLTVSGSATAATPTMIVREGVVSPTGGALAFEVENSAGTTILAVSGSGNVGIGTTGGTTADRLVIGSLGTASPFGIIIGESYGAGSGKARLGLADANRGIGLSSADHTVVHTWSTNSILFGHGTPTSLTERVRIDSSGNVGIGTSVLADKLAVNGSMSVTGSYLHPGVDNSTSLGASNKRWSNIYGTNILGNFLPTSMTPGSVLYINSSGAIAQDNANLFWNDSTKRLGIGTATPGFRLEVAGDFAATTKSFVIQHPTKPGWKLRYGSLEGPENGVYVRGQSESLEIELPDYWEPLVDPVTITAHITPVGRWQSLHVESIKNNRVKIGRGLLMRLLGIKPKFFYTVTAERRDVKFEVEYNPVG